jgi:hypothetical protein
MLYNKKGIVIETRNKFDDYKHIKTIKWLNILLF